jgi:hypothetical protein
MKGDGRWKMEDGKWKMENGRKSFLVNGLWFGEGFEVVPCAQ